MSETEKPEKNLKVKKKRLEDYVQSKPQQLMLFEMTVPDEKPYSNTIELYDSIPKYYSGSIKRIEGKFLNVLERFFEHRGIKYKVVISPARIQDKDGVFRDFYPSLREEIVEDALRKMACDGKGIFLDDQASVVFSLYELQQELARMGHGYNITQIKEALLICAKTNMEVSTSGGDTVVISNLFETLGLKTREDWKGHGKKSKAFVRFNLLVTKSIIDGTFRQLNYDKCMAYKSVIARRLHKRISHHYTQADEKNKYEINLSTIIRDFGITVYEELRNNLRQVEVALKEMKEKEVILNYEIKKIFSLERKNKIEDAKFSLYPHPRFITETIKANKRQKILKLQKQPNSRPETH